MKGRSIALGLALVAVSLAVSCGGDALPAAEQAVAISKADVVPALRAAEEADLLICATSPASEVQACQAKARETWGKTLRSACLFVPCSPSEAAGNFDEATPAAPSPASSHSTSDGGK